MDYGAMTVNERLYLSRKLDEYEKAIVRRDVYKVIEILKSVDIHNESIIPIIERLGFNKRSLIQYEQIYMKKKNKASIWSFFKNLFT